MSKPIVIPTPATGDSGTTSVSANAVGEYIPNEKYVGEAGNQTVDDTRATILLYTVFVMDVTYYTAAGVLIGTQTKAVYAPDRFAAARYIQDREGMDNPNIRVSPFPLWRVYTATYGDFGTYLPELAL